MRTVARGMRARGSTIEVRVKSPTRGWLWLATGLRADQIEEAQLFRSTAQAQLDAGLGTDAPLTVRRYAETWLAGRTNDTAKDDASRIRKHVLPQIGEVPLAEVRPRHIRNMVRELAVGPLAPRTIRNVYAVAHSMFRDAVVDELISATPCVLRPGDLPKKRDKDPEWRASAIFTRAEVEQLIADTRTPTDRRMFYALMFLTGSRFGEAAALRWRHLDLHQKPLARLLVARSYSTKSKREGDTKTETPRRVPVHPVLSKMLARWRLSGWPEFFGHAPGPDDLIVPSRLGKNRSANHMKRKFGEDLERLGMRVRRQHDARRTFKSIALDDGANGSRLHWITHGRRHGVDGDYDEPSWAALCEAMQAIRIDPRHGTLVRFRKAQR